MNNKNRNDYVIWCLMAFMLGVLAGAILISKMVSLTMECLPK